MAKELKARCVVLRQTAKQG